MGKATHMIRQMQPNNGTSRKQEVNKFRNQGYTDTDIEILLGNSKPAIRNSPRIGRNDTCPCGSGKKYKKCCHLKE